MVRLEDRSERQPEFISGNQRTQSDSLNLVSLAESFSVPANSSQGHSVEHMLPPGENVISQNGSSEKSTQRQWTVVVNFTASKNPNEDTPHISAEKLKSLASQSRGTGVTFVVQSVESARQDYPGPLYLKRYAIENGQIKALNQKDARSGTPEQNLTSLLKLVNHDFKSDKLALVEGAHGDGNLGLAGNDGMQSVKEFRDAVKAGLGGRKLDLLDLDSCLMAQNGVLRQLKDLTDTLVASEELEPTAGDEGRTGDGQHLGVVFKELLRSPEFNGKQLADLMVQTEKQQGNDSVFTLAHINMDRFDDYQNKLNDFAVALAGSGQKLQLQKIVECVPRMATFIDPGGKEQKRDLKNFVEGVQKAVASGALSDPDQRIASTARDLLSSMQQLIPAGQFEGATVDSTHDYKNMGGLSIFLPGRNFGKPTSATPLNVRRDVYRKEIELEDDSWRNFLRSAGLEVD